MARPDKAAAVAELTESFRQATAALLTEYRGLTVAQLKELRRSLAADARYAVVKNTLTKIAVRDAGVADLEPLLEGPSAIAFVTGDPVVVAKGIRDFAKLHPALVVKGGVLDGRPLTPADIRKLADLESREVLLSKLAGAMKGSLSQAVSLFAAPLSQMARLAGALQAAAEADPSLLRGGAGTPAPSPDAADVPAAAAADEAPTSATAEATTEATAEATEAADEGPVVAAAEEPAAEEPAAEEPVTEAAATEVTAEPAAAAPAGETPTESDAAPSGETTTESDAAPSGETTTESDAAPRGETTTG
jgi:large subunit ribosomal protein L10